MKKYVSEAREAYEDRYHGTFSKKLAEWAISNMKVEDKATDTLKPLKRHEIAEMQEVMQENSIKIPDKLIYTAWYLWNMAFADYPKALTTDIQRAEFVKETLLDIDCCPEAVLECFTAKMCCMGVPIFWENFL